MSPVLRVTCDVFVLCRSYFNLGTKLFWAHLSITAPNLKCPWRHLNPLQKGLTLSTGTNGPIGIKTASLVSCKSLPVCSLMLVGCKRDVTLITSLEVQFCKSSCELSCLQCWHLASKCKIIHDEVRNRPYRSKFLIKYAYSLNFLKTIFPELIICSK